MITRHFGTRSTETMSLALGATKASPSRLTVASPGVVLVTKKRRPPGEPVPQGAGAVVMAYRSKLVANSITRRPTLLRTVTPAILASSRSNDGAEQSGCVHRRAQPNRQIGRAWMHT